MYSVLVLSVVTVGKPVSELGSRLRYVADIASYLGLLERRLDRLVKITSSGETIVVTKK